MEAKSAGEDCFCQVEKAGLRGFYKQYKRVGLYIAACLSEECVIAWVDLAVVR